MFFAALMLFAAGCRTASKQKRPVTPSGSENRMLGRGYFPYPFQTIDELRNMVEGFGQEAHLYILEKDRVKTAICLTPQGGIGVNMLFIYTFDEAKKQWCPRVYWDTRVRGVTVTFNEETGIFEAHSHRGRLIFLGNILNFATKQPEELFPGKPGVNYGVEYPSFRTFEELKAAAEPASGGDRLYIFEKGEVKVGVRVQSWGVAGWKALILYTWDEIGDQWGPGVIWDSKSKEVRVTFAKSSGMIEVHSGDGKLIFRANIEALKARQNLFD